MTDTTGSSDFGRSAEIVDLEQKRKEVERRRRRSQDEVGELVEKMNKRFCVVPEGEDVYVYREQRDPLRRGRTLLNKFTFNGFRKLLLNQQITIEVPDPKKPGLTKFIVRRVADVWLEHKDRRECPGGPIFDPTDKPAKIGLIGVPERCANLPFGGVKRSCPFMAANHSLYAFYVNTQGVLGGRSNILALQAAGGAARSPSR